MGTPFTDLYDSVLSKIRDYDFFNMEQEQVYEILSDYLRPAIAAFRGCKQDISQRTETGFDCTLTDTEVEILANYMTIAYLDSNYIRVPLALKQTLSSKDFNAFSPANHLDKMVEMREKYRKDNETLLVRYSYIRRNTYLRSGGGFDPALATADDVAYAGRRHTSAGVAGGRNAAASAGGAHPHHAGQNTRHSGPAECLV